MVQKEGLNIADHMEALGEEVQEGTTVKTKRICTPERSENEPSDKWESNVRESR